MRCGGEDEVGYYPAAIALPSDLSKRELRNDKSENHREEDRVREGSVPAQEPKVAPTEGSPNRVQIGKHGTENASDPVSTGCNRGGERRTDRRGYQRVTNWGRHGQKSISLRPNGSRLSCGRLAGRRKSSGRQSVPARAEHYPAFKAINARQPQALIR